MPIPEHPQSGESRGCEAASRTEPQKPREPDEGGPEWRVIVQEDLPADVLRRMVTWAWRVMLPSYVDDYDKSWNGAVCRDEYGENRGCYYNGE